MVRSHRKPTSLADLELTGPRKLSIICAIQVKCI